MSHYSRIFVLSTLILSGIALVGCNSGKPSTPRTSCGDGAVTGNEACDGQQLSGQTCSQQGFSGGTLACNADCSGYDTSSCTNSLCGNGAIDGTEECDTSNMNGLSCSTFGYTGGSVSCDSFCMAVTTACTGGNSCGNGNIDVGEDCDGNNLNNESCIGLGWTGGSLSCSACSFNESACTGTTPCGNGSIDAGEDCDGTNLDNQTCATQGLGTGNLTCTTACLFSTMGCSSGGGLISSCGDGIANGLDSCEGSDFGPNGQPTCDETYLGTGGATSVPCTSECTLDLSVCVSGGTADICTELGWYGDGYCDPCAIWGGAPDTADCTAVCASGDSQCGDRWYNGEWICMSETGANDPDCGSCGNGTAEEVEWCDGADLRTTSAGTPITCADAGFTGGTLDCTNDCVYDFTGCTTTAALCSNDAIELPEICDGTDLAGLDCTDLGFTGGTLGCLNNCTDFDTALCDGSACGNNVIDLGEECDPPNGTTCDVNCQLVGGASMTSCGDNIMNGVDYCDGADFGPNGTPSCADILGAGGTAEIGCAADCTWNLTACTPNGTSDICAELDWYDDGVCDPCAIWGGAPDTADCTADCADDGICRDYWFNGQWACESEATADPDCGTCGNASLDGAEMCDDTDLGTTPTCADWGYTGGVLSCLNDCELDFRACTSIAGLCGDGVIDAGEICDSTNVALTECDDLGYTGGRLGCLVDCSDFDLTGCTGDLCGDNTADTGEICDGTDTGSTTCSTLGYTGGAIGCLTDCSNYDTTGCTGGPSCGNGVVEFGEQCDPPDGLTCDSICQRITLPICGNGIVEIGEECDPPDGTTCDSNCQAVTSTTRANSSPCTQDSDCTGNKCLTEGTYQQPGGYCTSDCSSSTCAATEECVSYGAGDAWCLPTCATFSDCRAGYSCIDGVFTTRPVCTPDCHLDAECTETGACDEWSGYCDIDDGWEHDGGACTTDIDNYPVGCESQFYCIDEASYVDFVDGYCLSMCSLETGLCPGDGVCLAVFSGTTLLGACHDGCVDSFDCRANYSCQSGICLPGGSTGPTCGDSVVDLGEECDPPNGTTCDSNCLIMADVCGNGIIEIGEECEPPSVGNCDADCLLSSTGRANGDVCTTNSECTGGVCLTEATKQWPGGFCTETCTTGSCGVGEECVTVEGGDHCMLTCSSIADCFPGYACFDGLGTIAPLCFPECNDDAECLSGGTCDVWSGFCDGDDGLALDGKPCTDYTDCESEFVCLTPADDGFRGGYCVSACSPELDLCPGDGVCANAWGFNLLWACIDSCFVDSDCRDTEGYTCQFGLCLPGSGGPACGNGVLEAGEQCDPPDGVTCDVNCQNIISVCGNGVLETGEQCDPPDGSTCGINCLLIGGGRVNGDACIQNSDCAGGVCLSEAGDMWPGGFCTSDCTTNACGSDEECRNDGTNSYCMLTCASFWECFPGYSCLEGFGTVNPICRPDCQVDAECTDTGLCNPWYGFCTTDLGHGRDGDACVDEFDCESEFFCVDEATYGFPGGYCLSVCALETGACPNNGVCDDSFGLTLTGACYAGCTTDNDCRTSEGYICVSGMCLP